MVVVDGATTVPVKASSTGSTGTSGTSSSSSAGSSTTTSSVRITPASKSLAAPPAQTSKKSGAGVERGLDRWVVGGVCGLAVFLLG